MNLIELAANLKATRLDKGMTLEDVASRAGLTRSWLSKVENFRVTPSLPALASISQALGVTLSELFEGIDAQPAFVVTRKGEGQEIRRDEDISNLAYESLAHGRPSRNMDPFVITVPKGTKRPQLSHGGEEFVYILDGAIEFSFADERIKLSKGDSAYLNGSVPHTVRCTSPKAAKLLTVYYGIGEEYDSTMNK
ncbi:MAG: cupin domain-containing protein [Leptolyngbya sp. SIO3F4]|nr:cupin domain-containing protein [Leptolyngbya sp. SIO3F4]